MKPYKTTIPNTDVSFEMIPIKGGEFTMGTPASENGPRKGRRAAAQSQDRPVLDGQV